MQLRCPEIMEHLIENDVVISIIFVQVFVSIMLNYCPLGLQDKILDNFLLGTMGFIWKRVRTCC